MSVLNKYFELDGINAVEMNQTFIPLNLRDKKIFGVVNIKDLYIKPTKGYMEF